jgi:hypothetical protein
MPESDNRTETDQPQSDNRTKEGEPKSDYPGLGFRIVGKSDGISNNLALSNKDFSQGRERNSNSKHQRHDYAVIPKSSPRYDVKTLINEEIFGSN